MILDRTIMLIGRELLLIVESGATPSPTLVATVRLLEVSRSCKAGHGYVQLPCHELAHHFSVRFAAYRLLLGSSTIGEN